MLNTEIDDAVELITSKIAKARNVAWSLKHAGHMMKPDELTRIYDRLYNDLNDVTKAFERLNASEQAEA